MVIIFDSIIWSLQKAGGISLYWAELLSGLGANPDLSFHNLESDNSNIIRKQYDGRIPVSRRPGPVFPAIARLRRCKLPHAAEGGKKAIYHSSYYRRPDRRVRGEVVTVHDMIPEKFGATINQYSQAWLKRKAVKRADMIICVSKNTREDLLKFLPDASKKKIYVVYNGVSESFSPLKHVQLPASVGDKKPYALFIGRRDGYKNFVHAVKAVSLIQSLSLVAVGGGALSNDEKNTIDRNLKGRFVHIAGGNDELLNQLYNGAFCLLYPSSYEGFGLPVVEAMRVGCPVVAVNRSSIPELVCDSFPLAQCEDPDALAECMISLENTDKRSAAISRGQARSRIFTWDRCVQSTLSVYRSIA